MVIAYELKQPYEIVRQLDRETIGYWLAFFKLKTIMEEEGRKKAEQNQRRRRR